MRRAAWRHYTSAGLYGPSAGCLGPRFERIRWTIRAKLTALVLALVLPLVAGAAFTLWLGTIPALLTATLTASWGFAA